MEIKIADVRRMKAACDLAFAKVYKENRPAPSDADSIIDEL